MEKTIDIEAQKKEIASKTAEAYKALDAAVDEYNEKSRRSTQERNEAPCSVCGKKEFVMKYRNVNGTIEGRVSGAFSLFGGSISGYVNGETHTDPVLSCRGCENERKIEIPHTKSIYDMWGSQLPYISTHFPVKPDNGKVSEWLQNYGLEVAVELSRKIRPWDDYHQLHKYGPGEYPRLSEREFGYIGLVKKYKVDGYDKGFEVHPVKLFALIPFVLFAWFILMIFGLL